MNVCRYIYCTNTFEDPLEICPVCGYPTHVAMLGDNNFLDQSIPKLPTGALVDMHQILPDEEKVMDSQLHMMDKLNIRRVLLQSVPSAVSSIWGNQKLLEIQNRFGHQFIASHFMDPRHPFARRRLHQYKQRGIRVIKLLPCLGYEPDHAKWDAFWATLEKLKLVAMVHTGFITARHKEEERQASVFLHSKFGRPILFDLLARKYPELQFILCHMGGAMWYEEAIQMVNQHDNVWGDISGFGLFALQRIVQNEIYVNWKKIVWGNDASPRLYPFNLRLVLHMLTQGDQQSMAPLLLHDNAIHFINRFLS